jgi:WD40 repeat protein
MDHTVKVWDAITGHETLTLKGHTKQVEGVSWSPDGTCLASASWDGTVKLWDTKTGYEALSLKGRMGSLGCVAWSIDGTRLASAGGGPPYVRLWPYLPLAPQAAEPDAPRETP